VKAGIHCFKALAIDWTPVFTGVTAEIHFFHTFGEGKGGGNSAFRTPNSAFVGSPPNIRIVL
jgi:hypothetical protein